MLMSFLAHSRISTMRHLPRREEALILVCGFIAARLLRPALLMRRGVLTMPLSPPAGSFPLPEPLYQPAHFPFSSDHGVVVALVAGAFRHEDGHLAYLA